MYMMGCSSPSCIWDRMAPSPVSHASVWTSIGTWKSGITRIGWEHSASFRLLKATSVSSVHFTVFGRQALVRSLRREAIAAKLMIN
jgi:hypothetical protein